MKFKPTPAFYSILLLLILWQALAMLIGYTDLFPSVTGLLKTIVTMLADPAFYVSLVITILRGLTGFALALVLAGVLAAIALHHPFWKSFFHPWGVVMRSVPVISIVLIALLWLSPPGLPVFIAFFTMFPILYQNMLSGLEHTDGKLVEMAKVFNKNSLQRLRYIYFPSARTLMLAGVATAMGFGWRAVIIGEVLAGPVHGIGTSMKKAQAFIDMKTLLAWTVIAIVVSFIFDFLVKLLAQRSRKLRLSVTKKLTKTVILNIDRKEISINSLNKSFNDVPVLQNLNLSLSNDHIHLLKTASGSGKTTLMNIIAGILQKDSGTLVFSQSEPVISYAFQDKRLIPWLTVEQNIAFALPHFPQVNQEEKNRIGELIHAMELDNQQDKLPDALSGGEQQRTTLARALALPCHVLLLDEPLTGLGQDLKIKIIGEIDRFTRDNKPVIVWATHEEVEGLNAMKYQQTKQ